MQADLKRSKSAPCGPGWTGWAVVAAVALAALVWGRLYLQLSGLDRRAPSAEQTEIAVHLARGHGYRSPFSDHPEAPPTAWSPPVYPYVLSWAYRVWGTPQRPVTVEAVRALGWLHAAALGGVAACAYVLVRRSFAGCVGVAGGLLAAAGVATHPMLLRFVGDYWDGMLALAMFFAAMVWADPRTGAKGAASCVGLGVLLGVLLLTNTAYVLAAAVLAGLAAWGGAGVGRGGGWRSLRRGAYVLLATAVTLAPWTLRNLAVFETWMLVRSGAGFELWLGNRPGLLGWMGPEVLAMHPYRNAAERERVLRMGEVAYSAEKAAAFRRAVAADPWGFTVRSGRRAAYLLVGEPASRMTAWPLSNERTAVPGLGRVYLGRTAVLSAVAAFGLAGAWAVWRTRRRMGWVLVAGVAAVGPYVVSSVSDRYALPLRAVLVVLGAAGVAAGVAAAMEKRATARREVGHQSERGPAA